MTNKKLELKLIDGSIMKETLKFRRGFFYYPVSYVFVSTTGQIHICIHIVKFPEEVKEHSWINAYMRDLFFTKCGIVAPFKTWIFKNTTNLFSDEIALKQLCSHCGKIEDFRKIVETGEL